MSEPGARIGGRYRLDTRLASGGMGTVWLGWDELLRRQVAIKRLHLQPGLSDAERAAANERAMREGRITARLHHPHAVQVYDVMDDDDGPCLIMQYVESRSLATVVTEDGPLAPHEVARIGTQLAAALAAAHRVGIVHRDVKPGNVLIGVDGTAKITDFGVSHAFDDVSITSTGMVTGTPMFLAPEVARGEQSDAASDVYSLGSTLYLAVEGQGPFGSEQNPMAILHRVASGRPRPPERAGALAPMLQAMMAPSPADRPTMVEIAGRLPDLHPLTTDGAPPAEAATQVLRVPPVSPAPAAATPTGTLPPPFEVAPARADETPRRRDGRRLALPLVAALLVVLLGVVLAVALTRSDDSGGPAAEPGTSAPATPQTRTDRSTRAASSATPTPSTSPTPTTSAPASSSSARPSSSAPRSSRAAAPTDAQLAGAIVQYFQLVPGDLDAGWARLTPGFQQGRAGGRGTYDDYWNSIDSVDVRNPTGDAPNQASALLVYHYKSGKDVSQQTTFTFVRQGGQLLISGQG